jgi:alkylation response protein AidB-like acyl-CoA dehydrogenase
VSSLDELVDRAVAWSNEHPPPIGAPAGSRAPTSPAEEAEWREWGEALHAAGLATLEWPREYGGAGATPAEVRAVKRVLRAAGQPLPLTDVALGMVGPAIMAYGTPEQKERFLPGIAAGTDVWTQLFSEPGAGSDLATLGLRARPGVDGGWVLDGQKVWSTYAHVARYGYLLARTDRQEDRHRALTMFLVPMDAPGVRVEPIRELTGSADFNEVFLDGVRVGPGAVLGEVDRGWAVSMSTLTDERAVVGGLVIGLEADAARLATVLDGLGEAALPFRRRLGEVLAEIAALTALSEDPPGPPAGLESTGKVVFSELNVTLHQLALDLCAAHPDAVPEGWQQRWADNHTHTRGYTISGGANELLRTVMGARSPTLPSARCSAVRWPACRSSGTDWSTCAPPTCSVPRCCAAPNGSGRRAPSRSRHGPPSAWPGPAGSLPPSRRSSCTAASGSPGSSGWAARSR